jgi:hypothetical protein
MQQTDIHIWPYAADRYTYLITCSRPIYTSDHMQQTDIHIWPYAADRYTHLTICSRPIYISDHMQQTDIHIWPYAADRYTHLITSRSVLLRVRNVSDKVCTECRNRHFVLNNFSFPKILPFRRKCGNIVYSRTDRPQLTTRRMRVACCTPKAINWHWHYVTLLLLFNCNNGSTNAPQYCIMVPRLSCYNRNGLCSLLGTSWFFKYSSGSRGPVFQTRGSDEKSFDVRRGTDRGFSPRTSVFPLSVSFQQCSILICMYFLLLAGQNDKWAEPGNLRKVAYFQFSFFFING